MLRLIIVTPERPFQNEECLNVTLPGSQGEMQILAGHAALVSELKAGILSYQKTNNEIVRCMVGEGFVEIDHDTVNVLVEQARLKSEVDLAVEQNLLISLNDKLKLSDVTADPDADAQQKLLFADIKRCTARLSLFE